MGDKLGKDRVFQLRERRSRDERYEETSGQLIVYVFSLSLAHVTAASQEEELTYRG